MILLIRALLVNFVQKSLKKYLQGFSATQKVCIKIYILREKKSYFLFLVVTMVSSMLPSLRLIVKFIRLTIAER